MNNFERCFNEGKQAAANDVSIHAVDHPASAVGCPYQYEDFARWWKMGYAYQGRYFKMIAAEEAAKQNALMIRVLQFGFSTGSITRLDCLRSFIRAYPEMESEVLAAAAEFEKGCCYCPEQHESKSKITAEQMKEWLALPRYEG